MSKVKVGIVEDELIIAQGIARALESMDYATTEPAISYKEAVEMIEREHPDIVLIDIQLKGQKDGIDLAERIKKDYNIPYIFLTANADAVTVNRAKQLNPPAYLVKPFNKTGLFTSIEICLHNYSKDKQPNQAEDASEYFIKDCLFIKSGQAYKKVKNEQILYLESDNIYVNVYATSGRYLLRNSIQAVLDRLASPNFIRVHKSYAVNADHIDSVTNDSIFMGNGEIPIGRAYRENVMTYLRLS